MNIYLFASYRKIVETYYKEAKEKNKRFTHKEFSNLCGFSSGNHSKLVMTGKINLGTDVALRYSQAMKFDTRAAGYFVSLVALTHAKTSEEFARNHKIVKDLRAGEGITEISEEQHLILSDWFYFTIRELLCLKDFTPTGDWISQRMGGQISSREASAALRQLLNVGLIKNQGNHWEQSTTHIKTQDEIPSGALRNFHKKILAHSANAIDQIPVNKREFLASSIAITEEMVPELKLKIKAFHDQILLWADNKTRQSPAEMVYQMNSQFFPMTVSAKKTGIA